MPESEKPLPGREDSVLDGAAPEKTSGVLPAALPCTIHGKPRRNAGFEPTEHRKSPEKGDLGRGAYGAVYPRITL